MNRNGEKLIVNGGFDWDVIVEIDDEERETEEDNKEEDKPEEDEEDKPEGDEEDKPEGDEEDKPEGEEGDVLSLVNTRGEHIVSLIFFGMI